MDKKIIVAGHICLDITPIFPNNKAKEIGEVIFPGKLVQMDKAEVSTGGAVANTGLAMKILGGNVSLVGKIGNDAFGDMVLNVLKRYDCQDKMLITDDSSTSYTVVIAISGIDRSFLHNPGANNNFYASDIDDSLLADATLFHFGYPTIMKSMYENDGEELVKLFKKVKENACASSLDLTVVDPSSDAAKVNWQKVLERVLPYVDFFVPSIEELAYILDKPLFDSWDKKELTSIYDIEKELRSLANKCLALGAKVVLIKCGTLGMYCCSADKERLSQISQRVGFDVDAWSNKEIFEKSYEPEKVLSATGAGDTSIAAFLLSVLNGENIEDCLHLAAAVGACCVTSYDSLSGLKPLNELKEKINKGWKKI